MVKSSSGTRKENKSTHTNGKKISGFPMPGQWRLTAKGHRETFGGDRNILYLVLYGSGGSKIVYICQNLLDYILKMGTFYYM